MKPIIADLDLEFPFCKGETTRQSIPQFSCCVRNEAAQTCDQMGTCRFRHGVFHAALLARRAHEVGDSAPPELFVGKSYEEGGFVVVWIMMLPVFTQAKWHTRVDDLINVLEAKKRDGS